MTVWAHHRDSATLVITVTDMSHRAIKFGWLPQWLPTSTSFKKGLSMNFPMLRSLALPALLLTGNGVALAQDVTGAGATFPAPVYAKWADAYNKVTGARINYQSVGSGAGIRQIKAKTVDFGASDMPLKDDELAKDGMVQFPMVIRHQCQGHRPRADEDHGPIAWRHLPRQDHQVE
jgi:PBP superfamily domain